MQDFFRETTMFFRCNFCSLLMLSWSCVFSILLCHYFHFSYRMSQVLGWILALNVTCGKPSWKKFRMAVQLCWHPTGDNKHPYFSCHCITFFFPHLLSSLGKIEYSEDVLTLVWNSEHFLAFYGNSFLLMKGEL